MNRITLMTYKCAFEYESDLHSNDVIKCAFV